MAFHFIEDVRINGKNSAFGGNIYSLQYSVGLVNEMSRLELNFVNKKGEFLEPPLSVDKPYKIQIGNIIDENFYAISWKEDVTSKGRMLSVQFIDGSHILDRLYVGLNKRHGNENTDVEGLILVGREIHPCDVNEDGVFDERDVVELRFNSIDPCELKCPNDENWQEPVLQECIDREIKTVLPIKYSFSDLLAAIQGQTTNANTQPRNIPIPVDINRSITITLPPMVSNSNDNPKNRIKVANVPAKINNSYLADFTGTLREVLTNWCAEFGWSFFWENDSLNFIDTKNRPRINFNRFTDLESLSRSKTLEGTLNRGFVSTYLNSAIEAETDCTSSKSVVLNCLTLHDLFGDYYKPVWNAVVYNQGDLNLTPSTILDPPVADPNDSSPDNQIEYKDTVFTNGVLIEDFEKSCVCAYYNENLRHLYNLTNYYGIRNATLAYTYKGKWLDRLGQLYIINVLSENVGSAVEQAKFVSWRDSKKLNSSNKPVHIFTDEERQLFVKNNGYFVLGFQNPELLKKQFEREERLASEFLGQHWLRPFVSPFMGDSPQITPNGQYFGALSTNIEDLPFTNFGHTYKSVVSQMVSSFVQRQRNNFKQYSILKYPTAFASNTSTKLVRSVVYFRKNSQEKWSPLRNIETPFKALEEELEQKMFKEIDLKDFAESEIRALLTNDDGSLAINEALISKVKLFAVFPYEVPITTQFSDNEHEEFPMHGEDVEPFKVATYGLMNKRCVRFRIKDINVYTPAAASVLFEKQNKFKWLRRETQINEISVSTPKYKVFVSTNIKNRGIIPKVESIYTAPPDNNSGLRTEYNLHDIDRDSLRFINKLNSGCVIDPQTLLQIHSILSKNLSFSVSEAYESHSFRLFGIRMLNKLSIKDGLESLKVSIDGAGGVVTEITLGNSLFTPQSTNYLLKMLELGVIKNVNNRRVF
jgi:hypothetical protein